MCLIRRLQCDFESLLLPLKTGMLGNYDVERMDVDSECGGRRLEAAPLDCTHFAFQG